MTDILTRRKDMIKPLESRSIFLQKIFLEKVKKEEYHPSIEMSELEKDTDRI